MLYTNPRGSTSYGEEFGNLIHHAYPGDDYDDLMSGVDALIAEGHVDTDNLFVENAVTGNGRYGVLFRDEAGPMSGHRNRFLR